MDESINWIHTVLVSTSSPWKEKFQSNVTGISIHSKTENWFFVSNWTSSFQVKWVFFLIVQCCNFHIGFYSFLWLSLKLAHFAKKYLFLSNEFKKINLCKLIFCQPASTKCIQTIPRVCTMDVSWLVWAVSFQMVNKSFSFRNHS